MGIRVQLDGKCLITGTQKQRPYNPKIEASLGLSTTLSQKTRTLNIRITAKEENI
jgi:hypothetical protein